MQYNLYFIKGNRTLRLVTNKPRCLALVDYSVIEDNFDISFCQIRER